MKYSSPEISKSVITGFVAIINGLCDFYKMQNLHSGSFVLKSDDSPVGDLDIAIESYVRKQMQEFLPNFQLIGEESDLPPTLNGNYLVIDPVDGTENFISGIPLWGTGMAIFERNKLVASWVAFPEISMGYSSKVLRGLTNDEYRDFRGPLQGSRVSAYSSNSDWNAVTHEFPQETRVLGCSLFNLILAARGSVTFKSSSKGVRIWDIAPAILVALELGKSVKINGKDYFGEFLEPNLRFVVEIQS
jgi:myo-inositol-1(or 4)-monophosphatase